MIREAEPGDLGVVIDGMMRIEAIIMLKLPILKAARATELLESGQVVGNVVLVAPEWM